MQSVRQGGRALWELLTFVQTGWTRKPFHGCSRRRRLPRRCGTSSFLATTAHHDPFARLLRRYAPLQWCLRLRSHQDRLAYGLCALQQAVAGQRLCSRRGTARTGRETPPRSAPSAARPPLPRSTRPRLARSGRAAQGEQGPRRGRPRAPLRPRSGRGLGRSRPLPGRHRLRPSREAGEPALAPERQQRSRPRQVAEQRSQPRHGGSDPAAAD